MTYQRELPPGWIWSTLAEACHVERGITFPASAKQDEPTSGGIACLRTANVQNTVDWDNLIYVPPQYVRSESKLLRQGDILISMANSRELVGKVCIVTQLPVQATLGGFIAAIRATGLVDNKYLFYTLRAETTQQALRRSASQTVNIANLSLDGIYSSPLPVPPLAEQRRIVAAIEQQFTRLDAGVATLRRVQATLKRYRAAVLKAAVEGKLTEAWRAEHPDVEPASALLTRILAERRAKWEADLRAKGKDPAKTTYDEPNAPDTSDLPDLPMGWCWTTFEQISERVTVGHVGPMKDEYIEDGIPFLRSQNVRPNRFDAIGLKFISREFHHQLQKSALRPGDVLVVRSGAVGTACVLPPDYPIANCSDLVIVKQPIHVNPHYAAYYMNSVAQSRVRSQQVGIALTHFNTQSMAAMPLPVPPLAEQELIVGEVEGRLSIINELEATVEANLKRAERLRQSILERAFSGQLVPQDPSDEPASALLERIRDEREGMNRAATNRTAPNPEPITALPRQEGLWRE